MTAVNIQCKCDLTMSHISQGEFSCRTGPADSIIFRARIRGTSSRSASDLASLIRTWVQSGEASIKVGTSRFHLDPTCDASLENIHAPDCVEKPTETPSTKAPTEPPSETPTKMPTEKPTLVTDETPTKASDKPSGEGTTDKATGNGGDGDSGAKAVGILLGGIIAGLLLALLIVMIIIIVMWMKKIKSQS